MGILIGTRRTFSSCPRTGSAHGRRCRRARRGAFLAWGQAYGKAGRASRTNCVPVSAPVSAPRLGPLVYAAGCMYSSAVCHNLELRLALATDTYVADHIGFDSP